jgi:hypothetical protein
MKAKQLGILLLAAVLLGGLGWYVRSRDAVKLEESKLRMGDVLLPGLDVNAVAGIRIQQGEQTLHVERKQDVWTVRERGGYPASFNNLAEFLRKLRELKITQPVEVGPSRLPALELSLPPEGKGIRLDLMQDEDKILQTLVVGKETAAAEDPSGFGAGPGGRYVSVGIQGGDIAKVSDPLLSVQTNPADWIQKDFFKVEQPISVEIQRTEGGAEGFSLKRRDEFGEWQLADAKSGEKLDIGKLGVYNSLLSFPSFNDVAVDPDEAALGLEDPTLAVVETAKGFRYEIKIGKPQAGETYAMTVQVTGTFPESRQAAEDESEEGKAQLDKEFEDDLKVRQEKLARESQLTGWVFLVNKWSIDALLKPRADLMADPEAGFDEPGAEFREEDIPEFDLEDLKSLLPDSDLFPREDSPLQP